MSPVDYSQDPKEIGAIAHGNSKGSQAAAVEAYRRLGEVVGDALGNGLTLIDGLAVIGGGLSEGHQLFLPALVAELNSTYTGPNGKPFQRLASRAFNLEDPVKREKFLKGDAREIVVPGSSRKIQYDPLQRVGLGTSRLGTSEAVAIGAYALALNKLS
ncbi:MAG: glucokinase [Pedosphaera sp.]|nr:glucokinase [Pedosphaera sp.]